jgi:hypothetical protein
MAASISRRIVRRTLAASAVVASVVLAIGMLHMPFARPLLMRLGGCPMAGVRMTAKEMENARHMAAASRRGGASSPARPALGFVLDATTVSEVREWAKRAGVRCQNPHPGLVVCTDVPARAVGMAESDEKLDEIAFGFSEQDRLVNATTMRTHLSPQSAEWTSREILSSLASHLGPAHKTVGTFGAAQLRLEPAASSISTALYRYKDYVADVSAMNLPGSGLLIREHYMSAND